MLTNMLKALALKFLKGKWGSLVPMVLTAAAEGEFGPGVEKVYRWLKGKKTVTGAILLGSGAALETICAGYPSMDWSCQIVPWLYGGGGILASVGLVDGGLRAPWPKGTAIPPEAKKG